MIRSVVLAGMIVAVPALAAESGIDADLAAQYFREARTLSEQDGGSLWGRALYGPMLFIDPDSQTLVGNRGDDDGKLRPTGDVFAGKLPQDLGVANTAQNWGGTLWTTVIWPLPADRYARQQLMMHELFHRVQDGLGYPMASPDNAHLATRDGRIWLRLELRALAEALLRTGQDKRRAIEDAVMFRAERHRRFPEAAGEERALELNEGLAEYTGLRLSGLPESVLADRVATRLPQDESVKNFQRSFAYASGPALGILLDQAVHAGAAPDWRARVGSETGQADLLVEAYSIRLPEELESAATGHALRYDGRRLMAAETEREARRQERLKRNRARFLESPVLVLPVADEFNYSFNPYGIETLPDIGQVFGTVTVTDVWGSLKVESGGALMVRDEGRVTEVRVSAPLDPTARPLTGDGWTLELADTWQVAPGKNPGNTTIQPR